MSSEIPTQFTHS